PLGEIVFAVRDGRLRSLDFAQDGGGVSGTGEIADRIAAYFGGDVTALDGIETDPDGTEFQKLVWRELRRTSAGERRSYVAIARAIGRPGAARAVGAANARNPVALVVPCHRVVGADGSLTGYAGGLERKQWLLE